VVPMTLPMWGVLAGIREKRAGTRQLRKEMGSGAAVAALRLGFSIDRRTTGALY
jgi:hypothetical protein